jgi:hypothetical protein
MLAHEKDVFWTKISKNSYTLISASVKNYKNLLRAITPKLCKDDGLCNAISLYEI